MSKFTNPLDNIKVASPCSQDWNQMIGTERKRFCGECQLNVYNLSEMSRQEAENFLVNSEGRLCVKFFRRADGSVLTKDCPVGWRAVRRRASKTVTAFASLIIGLLSGLGLTAFVKVNTSPVAGEKDVRFDTNFSTTGAIAFKPTPMPMMGNVSTERMGEYEVGGITSEQYLKNRPKRVKKVSKF